MPAITFWSVMTDLIRPVLPASSSARSSADSCSASGPSAAIPGTFFGSSTSHTASRFWVPASVRSKPGASPGGPRWTRSAIGPLPGFSGAAASLSDQRSQPARDRWVIKISSPARKPRYLPHRSAPVTVRPCSALIGGSKVFSTDNAATSTRPTVRPTAWRRRWSASASASGSSGMYPVCRSAPGGAPHHQRQHPADDRQDDGGPDRGPPEVVDRQPPMGGVAGDPCGDPQHQRVDHDVEQAQCEDVKRDRQDLHDRFDERVDQTEDHRDDEDDADSLQAGVATDEAQPVDDLGDRPQRESGDRGTDDEWTHALKVLGGAAALLGRHPSAPAGAADAAGAAASAGTAVDTDGSVAGVTGAAAGASAAVYTTGTGTAGPAGSAAAAPTAEGARPPARVAPALAAVTAVTASAAGTAVTTVDTADASTA